MEVAKTLNHYKATMMNHKTLKRLVTFGLVLALASSLGSPAARAVPYASGISQVGNTVSFVLNQNALSVEVLRDGGNPVYPGTAAGVLSFDMTGYTTFQIKVTGFQAGGWTQYVPDGIDRSFYLPVGVSINKIPSSPNFGKVYISEGQGGTTATFGRTTTSGIYMLRADGVAAGWANGGKNWATAGNSSPFKSTIGPDGHLYVASFSEDLVYEFSEDMTAVTQLIDASNKTTGQWVESIHVEGTQAGGDRVIYTVDSNYYGGAPGRKGLIRYSLGGNAQATPGDTGTQVVGPTYFGFYPRDVARDSSGNWYMNQFRSDPTQAPAISKFDGSLPLPINTALWETLKQAPYNGAYGIDINEAAGLVAYINYYDGWVRLFDMATGAYVDGFDAGRRGRELAFDAAGNLVTVDSLDEIARFWSPGGYTEAITAWDGTQWTFSVIPEPGSLSLLTLGGLLLLRRRRR